MTGIVGVEISPGGLVQEMVRERSAPEVGKAGVATR